MTQAKSLANDQGIAWEAGRRTKDLLRLAKAGKSSSRTTIGSLAIGPGMNKQTLLLKEGVRDCDTNKNGSFGKLRHRLKVKALC